MGKIGIPNGIEGGTSIGNGTLGKFEDEKTITKVIFGDNCTFVGNDAFENCILLSEINKDNVIEEIGSNAFAGTAITSAKFDDLTKLGYGAFKNCEKLNDIELGYCSSIGESAFEGCVNLNSIIMPNVKEIPDNAFKYCEKLNDIDLSYCTSIGVSAFEGCENLNSIMSNVEKIHDNAFKDCINLNNVELSHCSYIGVSAFEGCENLQKINLYNCGRIDDFAFNGCTNLKRVYIYKTDSVCELGTNVFGGVSDDDNIIFYIHPDIFDDYEKDSNWDGYNKVKMVQNNQIIYTTTNGEKVNINANVVENEYKNGYGLIKFNESVETLNNIFENKTTLKSIDLPESCTIIGENALSGCTNLTDITTLGSLTEIKDFAFQNCKSLTTFTIPQSVTTLGEGIFAGCSSIKKFNGKFVTYDGKSIVYNKKLICVLPSYDKLKLNISDINSSIETLGKKCFYGYENLRRIDIPSNITKIGDNAFEGCTNLREVHFHGGSPSIGEIIFGDIGDDFKIFILEDNLQNYFDKDAVNGSDNTLKYYSKYIYPKPTANSLIYYSSTKIPISNAQIDIKNNPFAVNDEPYYKTSKGFKITNISFNWFKDNANVKCVLLGENITGIDNSAFQNCKNLEYIYLPNDITYLGSGCFQNCSSLKKIHIPYRSINYNISPNIFFGCTNLKEFGTYDKNSVSDDGRCYIYNDSLIFFAQGGSFPNGEYKIPDSVKEIGRYAFKDFQISKIILSNNINKIGEYAFSNSSLKTIEWGENVETISAYAFNKCKNMDTDIPDSVNTIGIYAFYGCTGLKSININKNIKKISVYVFAECTNLKTVNINADSNLQQIDARAFDNCSNLESLNLSFNSNLNNIGEYAFSNCSNLESLNLSSDSNLKTIGNYAFSNCSNLASLNLSSASNLNTIGNYAFFNCTSLNTEINIPNGITTIGDSCFRKSGIKKLTINNNTLESISSNAFRECASLQSVEITSKSSNLKIIGESAFRECVELTKADIKTSSIEIISSYAFYGCKLLNGFSSILVNETFLNHTKQLPNSIKDIGDYAFYKCNKLWNIILPEDLSTLGTYCFGGANSSGISTLLTITVPENEKLVNPPAFVPETAKPFGEPATDKNYYSHFLSIYVPKKYADRYKIDKYWSKYKNNINNSSLPIDKLPNDKLQNDKLQNDYETVLPR